MQRNQKYSVFFFTFFFFLHITLLKMYAVVVLISAEVPYCILDILVSNLEVTSFTKFTFHNKRTFLLKVKLQHRPVGDAVVLLI